MPQIQGPTRTSSVFGRLGASFPAKLPESMEYIDILNIKGIHYGIYNHDMNDNSIETIKGIHVEHLALI